LGRSNAGAGLLPAPAFDLLRKGCEKMPTVLRVGPYRFFFYSRENNEPPHIHVERDDAYAKFWLDPIALASSRGFRAHELGELRTMVEQHRDLFLERWHEFFNR
jgi:hypothetical protein